VVLEAHRDFIVDEVRTGAFRAAIRQLVSSDTVVLDLGTGCGPLAFFAAEAGARRVIAIEQQHSADVASFLARHLGYTIDVIHARSTKTDVPELADLLVTETLGSFGLEERILTSVIDAKKRLLKPGSILIPSALTLVAVPVEMPAEYERLVTTWRTSKYGFDLSPLVVFASNSYYAADVDASHYLADPAETIAISLAAIDDANVRGRAVFSATRGGMLHGFGGWFRATLAPGIELSNARPGETHWRQVFLPVEHPIAVNAGTNIELELESYDGVAWRWRGVVGSEPFDQNTWLGAPPCYA